MKHLLTFFFLYGIWCASCRDQYQPYFNPRDASQITGFWHNDPSLAIPKKWYWHFSDGRLHVATYDFQVSIVEHVYGYRTNADTIFCRDAVGDYDKTYTVFFENDSTANMADVTNKIHIAFKLRRQ